MAQTLRRNWFVFVASLIVAVVSMALVSQTMGIKNVAYADPKGIKYTGAGACSAAACHGAGAPKEEEAARHNENTVWAKSDHHAQSYSGKKGLVSKKSKEIADKLKIADATKSDRCVTCHAVSQMNLTAGLSRTALKADQLGAKFSLDDGVSCDACHGPASKYLDPHTGKGWTKGQRAAGAAKLYDEWGLIDTKDLKMRGNVCLSCHLKIDADMVAAGHPELPFELNLFSLDTAAGGFYEGQHWRENPAWYGAKAWAMGQVLSLREAAHQLEERTAAKADAKLIEASQKKLWAHAILARQVAQQFDAASLAAIDAGLKGGDNKAIAAAAEALADKVNAGKADQAATEALLKNVAAEFDQAGNVGYAGAEQYLWALKSLYGVLVKDAKADAKKNDAIDALYDPLGEAGTYDAAKFVGAAKTMTEQFPGGKAIPKP